MSEKEPRYYPRPAEESVPRSIDEGRPSPRGMESDDLSPEVKQIISVLQSGEMLRVLSEDITAIGGRVRVPALVNSESGEILQIQEIRDKGIGRRVRDNPQGYAWVRLVRRETDDEGAWLDEGYFDQVTLSQGRLSDDAEKNLNQAIEELRKLQL